MKKQLTFAALLFFSGNIIVTQPPQNQHPVGARECVAVVLCITSLCISTGGTLYHLSQGDFDKAGPYGAVATWHWGNIVVLSRSTEPMNR